MTLMFQVVYSFVLEGLHHEALEDNCLRMNVSAVALTFILRQLVYSFVN